MKRRMLITGGASGIGAIVARSAIGAGYEVIISDVDCEAGAAREREFGAVFWRCDLRSEEDIVELIKGVGPVSVLLNNAGCSGPTAPVTEIRADEWRNVLEVNLTAQFLTCREMAPLMRRAGGGCIINISSVAGRTPYPNRSAYAASKWGVLGFTVSIAQELAADGIRVNAILPGAVRGARIESVIADFAVIRGLSIEQAQAHYLGRQAMGRFVEPEEIAEAVLFLASDGARSITGQFISVDGGYV